MQVCNPQEIRQAHSQYPRNSRVSLEKPLSLTWLRTTIVYVWLRGKKYKHLYWLMAYLDKVWFGNSLYQCWYNFGHHDLPVLQSFLFWFLDHRSHYNWKTLTICNQLNRYENIESYMYRPLIISQKVTEGNHQVTPLKKFWCEFLILSINREGGYLVVT